MNKKQKVLITGGAGLIGSHLCDALINNFDITCVDNFITGRKENIQHLFNYSNFKFFQADIIQQTTIRKLAAEKFDYIFHLASPASPKGYQQHPIETYQVNAFGTHRLLQLAKKQNARFLFTSTSEIYGDPLEHPQKETYWGHVNPIGERSCYDESKRFGEMACMTFYRQFNLDVRIVRIFNTFGPRNDPDDGRVVPSFIVNALTNKPLEIYGKGGQTRSFCYVTDLVEGLKKTMFAENQAGLVVNLGNPDEFKIIDFAKLVIKLTNSKSQIIFKLLPADDPRQRKPDITKAIKILNWQPEIKLAEGLLRTIEYYQKLL